MTIHDMRYIDLRTTSEVDGPPWILLGLVLVFVGIGVKVFGWVWLVCWAPIWLIAFAIGRSMTR